MLSFPLDEILPGEATMSEERPNTPRLVRDLMKVGVPTCSTQTTVAELARFMLEKDLEAVVVLNEEDGHALGVVSQDELVKVYNREGVRDLKAEEVMRDGLPQAPPDIPLEAAAQLMRDQGVRALFQVHHAGGIEYPAAMLTYKHLMRHLAAENDEELRDLGIKAERQSPLEVFIQRRDAARSRHSKQKPTKS